MGDALDTLTLREVRDAIRGAIGHPAEQLGHTCDVIVEEVCRQWPERHMADLARKLGMKTTDAAGEEQASKKLLSAKKESHQLGPPLIESIGR